MTGLQIILLVLAGSALALAIAVSPWWWMAVIVLGGAAWWVELIGTKAGDQ